MRRRRPLQANEVAILPYFLADLNIEATYAALTGKHQEFPNLYFIDTLANVGAGTRPKALRATCSAASARKKSHGSGARTRVRLSVIIGNPPYNASQLDENENNKNREWRPSSNVGRSATVCEHFLDEVDLEGGDRIKETIKANLHACEEFVVLLSPSSITHAQGYSPNSAGRGRWRSALWRLPYDLAADKMPDIIEHDKSYELSDFHRYVRELIGRRQGKG